MGAAAFLFAMALFGVAACAFALAASERRREREGRPVALGLALVACVTATLVLTLSPIDDPTDLQLLPLSDVVDALTPPLDAEELLTAIANVLLFVPLGAVLGLWGFRLGATAALGLGLSVIVELTQLVLVSGRTTSVDDLLLNTIGAAAGWLLVARWLPGRGVPSTP